MKNFPKYGSIENLYRRPDILQHECVILEKIHGTNVRVMWSPENGGLVLGSRNNTIYKNGQSTDQDGYSFGAFMEKHPCLEVFHDTALLDNYVFYGEFHGSNIQKGVKYCEEKDFRVFDIRDSEGKFLEWEEVKRFCKIANFKTVPEIAIGKFDISFLEKIRDNVSEVGKENGFNSEDNIWEGVVIKPCIELTNNHNERLIAKYKSDKWAENTKSVKIKSLNSDKIELHNKAQEFAEFCVTDGRISNVVEHITRDGNTELDIKRTGEFLRELVKDVMEEHADVYSSLNKDEVNAYNKAVSSFGVKKWQKCLIKNKQSTGA